MRTVVLAAVAAALVAALAAPVAQAGEHAAGTTGPAATTRLSDEKTITRWAHVARRDTVRTAPRRDAAAVARLRYFTEDGLPEVYLALRSRRVGNATWVQVRVPMRPNGRTGWVRASALGRLNVVRTRLVIDRTTLRAVLTRRGKAIWRAPVGVGAPGTPTPAGRFFIRERLRGMGGIYGPWAFGTSAYSVLSDWPGGGVVGIHGTNQPALVPGRPSHGCIRVRNADIRRLARLMPIGTPVLIR